MFGAISVSLFGNLDYEKILRLAAIVHGVNHYEHYLEVVTAFLLILTLLYMLDMQFTEKIETISDAVQFLATVASNEGILKECKFEMQTPAQVIEYTLMSEIQ